ncbi:1-deoxy-D-xylulose 5-phosphate reductoisomerase [Desulfonema limicola]|uniref:1-deoxy-D-xylulose 5-phosphate reductoisomerase n=1 Tax=Desulfonema limicola TaxID=45656 RepID=A0A975GIJ0_9BACT|nr:1-deoxy-D-xylulose-5-phosphate reductoisomerase [Desulfonema limicola]QTA82496.1 1-deoxy-D-xylulose 5-phosphate reductoisomerase [Desulfonema limicola]
MKKKSLSVLGSTGSIGRNVLKIAGMFPDFFDVRVLTAKDNVKLLADQIKMFKPELAVVFDKERENQLKQILPDKHNLEILNGESGYIKAAEHESVNMVIAAMMGAAGLKPTLAAIDAGKQIGLANKETLVMAGGLVMKKARQKNIDILPIDSEHSAIFQCMLGHRREDLDKILLTASGGPFLNTPKKDFANITPERALKHPNWSMGRKISIDSATLMNKGLEVIEAKHLFGISQDRIQVVVHPQSIIHSMVSYRDGSVIAQLGVPDMKGAIAYAMSYPERLPINQPVPDFAGIGSLTFQDPDMDKFPCLAMAFQACKTGGTMPAVLNAANEIAVEAFLNKDISFLHIPEIIQKTMEKHEPVQNPDITAIIQADQWARENAGEFIQKIK